MKGDFSRITFDPKKHYSRVLMQQGRVQLDADWNEQVAILLHRLETMARDLIGPFGGPKEHCGFAFTKEDGAGFLLSEGRYYVDGMLCVNDDATVKFDMNDLAEQDGVKFNEAANYLLYLDAWEQYLNASEDPDIRETALGGPDTSGRSKVVWSVRIREYDNRGITDDAAIGKAIGQVLSVLQIEQQRNGRLKVKVEPSKGQEQDDSPCILSPGSRFRGLENQLYRVEIHNGTGDFSQPQATFKWSRENGSVIFPISTPVGATIVLEPGHSTMGLKGGDWVELLDDHRTAQVQPERLQQVKSVDAVKREIGLMEMPAERSLKHPFLRRWESGAIEIVEDKWVTLEDGISIQFVKQDGYRSGDYWCFPARTAGDGNITWPDDGAPPDGVIHHYAPLAAVSYDGKGPTLKLDCRKIFPELGAALK